MQKIIFHLKMATQPERRVGWCRHPTETAATLDPAAAASGVTIVITVLQCYSVTILIRASPRLLLREHISLLATLPAARLIDQKEKEIE